MIVTLHKQLVFNKLEVECAGGQQALCDVVMVIRGVGLCSGFAAAPWCLADFPACVMRSHPSFQPPHTTLVPTYIFYSHSNSYLCHTVYANIRSQLVQTIKQLSTTNSL